MVLRKWSEQKNKSGKETDLRCLTISTLSLMSGAKDVGPESERVYC